MSGPALGHLSSVVPRWGRRFRLPIRAQLGQTEHSMSGLQFCSQAALPVGSRSLVSGVTILMSRYLYEGFHIDPPRHSCLRSRDPTVVRRRPRQDRQRHPRIHRRAQGRRAQFQGHPIRPAARRRPALARAAAGEELDRRAQRRPVRAPLHATDSRPARTTGSAATA